MRIAIIGHGQLARMLALAGIPLGLKFSFVADHGSASDTTCVDGLGIVAPWQRGDDIKGLFVKLGKPEIVTVEKEQVDLELLQGLSRFSSLRPNFSSVASTKNRLKERQLLQSLHIPIAAFSFGQGVHAAAQRLGYPFVLKSIEEGYDGKNQWLIKTPEDIDRFLLENPDREHALLAEQWINFSRELSLIAVRSMDKTIQHYCLSENSHKDGILLRSIAPAADINPKHEAAAQKYCERLMEQLDYIGVLAIEFFETQDGLIVNELAPRVHNSGHWTQSGSFTCQFENHLRAISGLSTGSTASHSVSGMLNLLGNTKPPQAALSYASTLNWYNKQPKPARKLGHVNFTDSSRSRLLNNMRLFEEAISAQ